jgi:hypothetical protein
MTRYDDDRVVTLLREVELPAAPPDRLTQVGRRARARESRLMSGLAGVLALVLAGGAVGVASLRGDDKGQDALTVASAAQSTADAGSARVTIRLDMRGLQASLPAGVALPKDPHLSGVVDFAHRRFALRGNLTGIQMEQRGIGQDRWERIGNGTWEHSTETSSDDSFDQVDPSRLLAKLTSKGKTLSTERHGDRTVFRIQVPPDVLTGENPGGASTVARVEADSDQRVRELTFTEGPPGGPSLAFTMTFDDFGVDADIRPPPADQVVEAPKPGATGSQGEVSITGSATPMPPEQACRAVATVEQQRASMTDEQQQKAFDQLLVELRKQCGRK